LGGTDGTTTLVDVASRQVLGPPLVPPLNMVVEESFSSNNKVLAAKHKSGFVLWNVDYPSWRQLARGVANRELTAAEKQQYLGSKP
jgi:hypothetical protein